MDSETEDLMGHLEAENQTFLEKVLAWFKRNGGKLALILLLISELLGESCLPVRNHSIYSVVTDLLRQHSLQREERPEEHVNIDPQACTTKAQCYEKL